MPRSLLFLPDISGFTAFVNSTEIEHSQHIVAELLEIMINANDLDLVLAEIEGDALFFYREAPLPSQKELEGQVERMFLAFHNHLRLYEHQRLCDCGACKTAVELKLKFVAHVGEIQYLQLKGFKKPHGKSVIQVHRLMKNKVPLHEYLLMSDGLVSQLPEWVNKAEDPYERLEDTYDAGVITYHFKDMTPAKSKLSEPGKYVVDPLSRRPFKLQKHINRPAKEVFEIISNFEHRHRWNPDAGIKYKKDRINRVGTNHLCVVNDREIHFETISKPHEEDAYIYGEKTSNIPLMKRVNSYYIIKPNGSSTDLTLEIHFIPKSILGQIVLPLFKRKFRKISVRQLENIKDVAEELVGREVQYEHISTDSIASTAKGL